jgi:hypothetical protein
MPADSATNADRVALYNEWLKAVGIGSVVTPTSMPAAKANSMRCGTSWADANSKCGTPCPKGMLGKQAAMLEEVHGWAAAPFRAELEQHEGTVCGFGQAGLSHCACVCRVCFRFSVRQAPMPSAAEREAALPRWMRRLVRLCRRSPPHRQRRHCPQPPPPRQLPPARRPSRPERWMVRAARPGCIPPVVA